MRVLSATTGLLASAALLQVASPAAALEIPSEKWEGANCAGLAQQACKTVKDCTWCQSAAVPSKCYDADSAKKLPPGVFICDSGNEADAFLETVLEFKEHDTKERRFCDEGVKQYSGYFRLQKQNKHYFYWAFESRNDPANDPVVLWMTGGPGCSSEVALFGENGPCKVNSDGTETKSNPFSWNSNATLIYIDQPAGTGFSYGTFDHDEKGVSEDMYQFLTEWLGHFKQFQKNKFYIFGESYAGHYVPATTHRVWLGNKRGDSDVHINLAGMAVGNGLTDPEVQYKYFPDMAFNSTTTPSRISKTAYKLMKNFAVPACISLIRKCNEGKQESACSEAFYTCNMSLLTPVTAKGWNQYDLREKCKVPPLCYDFSGVEKFLRRTDVRKALGVAGEQEWSSCNTEVNAMFRSDWMHNYQDQIPDLLEDNIPVLIYAGDADFVCNWIGNKAWTLEMDWSGKAGFVAAEDKLVKLRDGTEAGKLRSYNGFSFLQVFAAGHMVPLDQPEVSLAMLNAFTHKKSNFGETWRKCHHWDNIVTPQSEFQTLLNEE